MSTGDEEHEEHSTAKSSRSTSQDSSVQVQPTSMISSSPAAPFYGLEAYANLPGSDNHHPRGSDGGDDNNVWFYELPLSSTVPGDPQLQGQGHHHLPATTTTTTAATSIITNTTTPISTTSSNFPINTASIASSRASAPSYTPTNPVNQFQQVHGHDHRFGHYSNTSTSDNVHNDWLSTSLAAAPVLSQQHFFSPLTTGDETGAAHLSFDRLPFLVDAATALQHGVFFQQQRQHQNPRQAQHTTAHAPEIGPASSAAAAPNLTSAISSASSSLTHTPPSNPHSVPSIAPSPSGVGPVQQRRVQSQQQQQQQQQQPSPISATSTPGQKTATPSPTLSRATKPAATSTSASSKAPTRPLAPVQATSNPQSQLQSQPQVASQATSPTATRAPLKTGSGKSTPATPRRLAPLHPPPPPIAPRPLAPRQPASEVQLQPRPPPSAAKPVQPPAPDRTEPRRRSSSTKRFDETLRASFPDMSLAQEPRGRSISAAAKPGDSSFRAGAPPVPQRSKTMGEIGIASEATTAKTQSNLRRSASQSFNPLSLTPTRAPGLLYSDSSECKLPAEKVFPIQIGSELFRLSGASLASDSPSYFSQFFEKQLSENGSDGGVRTLYIDRDPVTFQDISRHLQGYHIKPRDGPHYVKLFADAQFYSLPRLIAQLFESEIFMQIGTKHFSIPKDIFSGPGNSPNFFSLGFAVFFSTPNETFPGLDRRGLLRPPSIQPPSVPNRSEEVFEQLIHMLRGYDIKIRDETHRAELLRDCRYFHLKGLEQRLIPHDISYNLERKRSEILIRLEDIKPSGVSFTPSEGTVEEPPSSPETPRPLPTAILAPGAVSYARPFVDESSHALIFETSGPESSYFQPDQPRISFEGATKARITALINVVANKMNLPTQIPLGLVMKAGGSAGTPSTPSMTSLTGGRDDIRAVIGPESDISLDGQPYISNQLLAGISIPPEPQMQSTQPLQSASAAPPLGSQSSAPSQEAILQMIATNKRLNRPPPNGFQSWDAFGSFWEYTNRQVVQARSAASGTTASSTPASGSNASSPSVVGGATTATSGGQPPLKRQRTEGPNYAASTSSTTTHGLAASQPRLAQITGPRKWIITKAQYRLEVRYTNPSNPNEDNASSPLSTAPSYRSTAGGEEGDETGTRAQTPAAGSSAAPGGVGGDGKEKKNVEIVFVIVKMEARSCERERNRRRGFLG